jgi:succinate dehydrogenase / fumarate reductase, membrane anchor subunit
VVLARQNLALNTSGNNASPQLPTCRWSCFSFGILLALFSITWHMRLGLQVVIEDYVHSEGRKLAAVTLNTFFVFALTALGAFSILKMGFGL